jgi:hypothetical protein
VLTVVIRAPLKTQDVSFRLLQSGFQDVQAHFEDFNFMAKVPNLV